MLGMLPLLAPFAAAGVVVPVPDDGFRSVWYEWKKSIDDQLWILKAEEENASLWNAVPKAVCMMLLKHEEEALYNRMYAEEDALLAAYVESGQPVPDEIVARLKEMIGRYADAQSEILLKQGELDKGWVIVSSAGYFFINPDKDFRKRMDMELSDLFSDYGISKLISKPMKMSDADLKDLFMRRVAERKMLWKNRRAKAPSEHRPAVALPRLYGNDHVFPYTNSSIISMTRILIPR